MAQPIKRDLKVSLKELESIKENIIYCGGTGTFYRKRTPDKPLSFNYANRQATICVKKENGKKYFTAWRMAVYFSHGYYPSFEDAVIFKDGDNYNFRINNATKKIIFKPYVEILSKHINNEYFKKKNSLIRLLLKFFLMPKKIFYNDFYIYKDI